MIDSVSKLSPASGLDNLKALNAADSKQASGPSFTDYLSKALEQVNAQQVQAEQMTEALATGQAPDLHSVMIAAEKATISFQLAVQVRNKALEAYQEIMRMQL
jgi:flagellar hook-basal body complex protein FliE